MTLKRKPRAHERLSYVDDRRRQRFGTVLRFFNDDIVVIQYDDDTAESLFIWRFHDGLNNRLSHVEVAP